MQHGFPITNISGDKKNRYAYYSSLEVAQVENNKSKFYDFVSNTVLNSLEEFLKLVS
jgi:hypothetical protein